ncbi:hypothetical protein [Myxosarcina sp. GI1(2024)]
MANVKGVKEPWAVITDEEPSLQTLWQYALRFGIEELFLYQFEKVARDLIN